MSSARKQSDEAAVAWLEQRLEAAGATLLAMPQRGMGPRLRQVRWPESFAGERAAGEGADGRRLRPPVPTAADISRMDETYSWIGLIPADRVVLRRIVHARSLVSPLTGRHIYSWRKVAVLLGADHRAVQRWYLSGLALMLDELEKLGKRSCICDHYRL